MKNWQILMIGALLTAIFLLTSCSRESTQVTTVQTNDTLSQNLGTTQNTTIEPQLPEPTLTNNAITPGIQTPKVSVASIEAFGSRFASTRYVFNKVQINFTADRKINFTNLLISVGNQYFNGTFSYNQSINCSNIIGLLQNRNKAFAEENNNNVETICFAPGRDMSPQDSVNVTGSYNGETVISQIVTIPAGVVKTYVRLK